MPTVDVLDLIAWVKGQGGVHARDLPPNAVLMVQVGGRQVEMSFGENPSADPVCVRSDPGDDWVIWLHIAKSWGSTAGLHTASCIEHWLSAGSRLYIGPFFLPVIEKIVLQGIDLANPSASQLQ